MKIQKISFTAIWLTLFFSLTAANASAQTTAFTYQGRLTEAGGAANGTRYFRFTLYDENGAAITSATVEQTLNVTGGIFTAQLNFGATAFEAGATRTLEIAVKTNAGDAYTVLNPRQEILAAPYAVKSLAAATADGFVQNTTTQQTGDFNLSGNGTLGGTLLANRVGINVESLQAGINLDVSGNAVVRTANGNINLGTPNSETGMTITTGTSRADLRFDGTTLKLVAGTGGIPSATKGIVVTTLGDIGIGTTTPAAKLDVKALAVDGLHVSSDKDNAVYAVNNGFGNGIQGISLGNVSGARGVYGLSNGGIGVEGVSNGGNNFGVFSSGFLGTDRLGTAGNTQLCLNFSNQIAICGSSLRYKKDFQAFTEGLSFINQLRPISYKWKSNNAADIGFGAEDVEKINPLFVTYNAKGEVEGVKYDRLSVTFVNAFKEQQAQIERQQKQLEQQKALIDNLKKLVCSQNPEAEVCRQPEN